MLLARLLFGKVANHQRTGPLRNGPLMQTSAALFSNAQMYAIIYGKSGLSMQSMANLVLSGVGHSRHFMRLHVDRLWVVPNLIGATGR